MLRTVPSAGAVALLLTLAAVCTPCPPREAGERAGRQRGGAVIAVGEGRRTSALALVRSPHVQTELKLDDQQQATLRKMLEESRAEARRLYAGLRPLTSEQRERRIEEIRGLLEKRSAEFERDLHRLLKPEQQRRLREVRLQRVGWRGLMDESVAEALQLDSRQQTRIEKLLEAHAVQERRLMRALQEARLQRERLVEIRGRIEALRKATDAQMESILTAAQQTAFSEMKGAPFEPQPVDPPPRRDPEQPTNRRR